MLIDRYEWNLYSNKYYWEKKPEKNQDFIHVRMWTKSYDL